MHSKRRNPISYHPPHLQPFLTRHSFKRFPMVNRQFFSSILVQDCWPHKHLTILTNGSSVTAHDEYIFERNFVLLHKMLYRCIVVTCGMCSPPPWSSMPFCQQVRFTHSHNISKWHLGSRGKQGQTSENGSQRWKVPLQLIKKGMKRTTWYPATVLIFVVAHVFAHVLA